MSTEQKVWPYGTIIIDNDGEVLMLLGVSPDNGDHNMALRLIWRDENDWDMIDMRPVISEFINMGDRYRTQE